MRFGFDDDRQGAPRDPEDCLKGEVLASLSSWTADFKTVRLELAWTVLQMLLKHVERQGMDVYVEFCDKAGAELRERSDGLKAIYEEDHRRRMH
uniref:hypothetical protein n=1 Tax=Pararhizobium sp. IMCC3301 TaxID=3067904 RepID=UPI00274133D7|nr:hypothetical protein [Pararhizobium sp. IMCC3301]